jgi:hypothetical protein
MTTTLPPQQPSQQQEDADACSPLLSSPSTLWVPLDETTGNWADFAHDALTVSALLAVGCAFYGLAWETTALRHYTRAASESERQRPRQQVRWLEKAASDLDCALDQWQQALGWLELAATDQQQALTSQQTMRRSSEQTNLHQERRRALHRQVLEEYASVRQQGRTLHTQRSEKGR